MKQLKSVAILDMIERRGGMRFTDIQRELWAMLYGSKEFTRENRGWWCTNLLGDINRDGLLRVYCNKVNGKWVRNNIDHCGRPWKTMNKVTNHNDDNILTFFVALQRTCEKFFTNEEHVVSKNEYPEDKIVSKSTDNFVEFQSKKRAGT